MFDGIRTAFRMAEYEGRMLRKKKEEGAMSGIALASAFIGIFISIFIITALWPTFSGQVHTIQSDTNTSTTSKTLWGLVGVFVTIGIVVAIVYGFIGRK